MAEALTVQPGRLDELLCACAQRFVSRVEVVAGVPLWDAGLGDLVRAAVAESDIPKVSLQPVDLARYFGLMLPAPVAPGAAASLRPRARRNKGGR